MFKYVVEKHEHGHTMHIAVRTLSEAQSVLCSIPKAQRGGTYPLYIPDDIFSQKEVKDEVEE